MGAKTRFFKVLVVDGLHNRVRYVKPGEVHQFKRTKFEAHLISQNPVDGGEIGHTFPGNVQSLGVVGAACVVDDKAWSVLSQHRGVPHIKRILVECLASLGRGLKTRNHLHHFHQRHRVEKMKPRQTLGVLELGRNGVDGQG